MRNFETKHYGADNMRTPKSPVDLQGEKIKNVVKNTLGYKVTDDLAQLFGMKNTERLALNQKTKQERMDFSDTNEVNTTEAQLARLFGKNTYDNIINLNKKVKEPLSMASVLSRFDILQAV